MKIAQRFILLSGLLFFLVCFRLLLSKESDTVFWGKWKEAYMDRFLNTMCRNRSISCEEYLMLYGGLEYTGDGTKIRIDEYKKEQDLDRIFYYSPMTWEEIRDVLWEKGSYNFEEGSIVRLSILWLEEGQEQEIRKFGRISEEKGNGT